MADRPAIDVTDAELAVLEQLWRTSAATIRELTDRGHSVVLTAAHKRNKPLKLAGPFASNPRVDVVTNPVRRTDDWEPHVRPLRQARDYLRFFDPRYARKTKLEHRAAENAPA